MNDSLPSSFEAYANRLYLEKKLAILKKRSQGKTHFVLDGRIRSPLLSLSMNLDSLRPLL